MKSPYFTFSYLPRASWRTQLAAGLVLVAVYGSAVAAILATKPADLVQKQCQAFQNKALYTDAVRAGAAKLCP